MSYVEEVVREVYGKSEYKNITKSGSNLDLSERYTYKHSCITSEREIIEKDDCIKIKPAKSTTSVIRLKPIFDESQLIGFVGQCDYCNKVFWVNWCDYKAFRGIRDLPFSEVSDRYRL